MIFVLFEVAIRPEYKDRYLEEAAGLKELLEQSPGFIRSERFSSLAQEGKLLSLSVWEDEESVSHWRQREEHRASQKKGRELMFEDYRITVSSPLRVYSLSDRDQAPEDSRRYFEE